MSPLTLRHDVLVSHQPAYLPWCGYFSRLLDVGTLLVLDHVQFSERGRQHRNLIWGPDGPLRLTVPVRRRFGQQLHDVGIDSSQPWAAKHWRAITQTYQAAPFWGRYADGLADLYARPWTHLLPLTTALTGFLLEAFNMPVQLVSSATLAPAGAKTSMLIDLCRKTGTSVLRVGSGAVRYLDAAALSDAEISVEVATYSNPPYPQRRPPFLPNLSALDLLLNRGPAAAEILRAGAAIDCWPAGVVR
ncbi:WbqC family protein [Microtetraspora malaysiensis]|uniref:WbqC family protein n=1 Tax=Microtetraspora malaysiensis TaxID=161358 RepID=A0ABW6SMK4_9ACTN